MFFLKLVLLRDYKYRGSYNMEYWLFVILSLMIYIFLRYDVDIGLEGS